MQIGFIGTGTIATAVIHGIADDGHKIYVSHRSTDNAHALDKRYPNVSVADNQAILDQSNVVFIGLMSEQAFAVLPNLRFRNDQHVISFMAGATLKEVEQLCHPAPACAVMMPFPGIALGGSPVLMLGDDQLVREIFGARNTLYVVTSEEEMQAYLCAQAVLSPVARLIEETRTWSEPQVEDAAQAETFLRDLVASSLRHTPDSQSLIEALNTPGGYNQRLRIHMEEQGLGKSLTDGLDALAGD